MNRLVRLSVVVLVLNIIVNFMVREGIAAGAAPQPSICTRACWGASSASGITQMSALTRAIIHHTAGSEFNTTSLEASKANVRAIQNLHKNNGWGDIGYHFLVDKFGNIFEGRLGSITSLPRGIHDAGNTNSFGFTAMGYFHPNVNNVPTAAMMNALYDVIAWRMPAAWRPYGTPGGTYGQLGRTVGYVDGHRNVVATACPGDGLYNPYIGNNIYSGYMRDQINLRINLQFTPTPSPSVVVRPDGRTAVFALGAGEGGVWMTWQNVVGGGYTSPWTYLGGSGYTTVQGLYDAPTDCFKVLACGNNGPLMSRSQLTSGGAWGDWISSGGSITNFDAVLLSNGVAFATAVGGTAVWTIQQNGWNGPFSAWYGHGGTGFSKVRTFVENTGQLVLFGMGPGSPLWSRTQITPGSGSWGSWVNHGGALEDFDVVKMGTGHPIVIATSGGAAHRNFRYGSNTWTGWGNLGGSGFKIVDLVYNPVYGPVFYGTGATGQTWIQWMNYPYDTWSGWQSLGGALSSFNANAHANGVNILFGRDKNNGHMYGNGQIGPGQSWQGWFDMGCCFQ